MISQIFHDKLTGNDLTKTDWLIQVVSKDREQTVVAFIFDIDVTYANDLLQILRERYKWAEDWRIYEQTESMYNNLKELAEQILNKKISSNCGMLMINGKMTAELGITLISKTN
jgi:hypothetical protein